MTAGDLMAQVTSQPSPLQEDSKDVTIFFHADQGNKGLINQPASAQIYAHTGVILKGGSDWVSAPTWGDNSEKYKLTYVSENLWKLYIGDIRSYYGITDPAKTIEKLAFVFRTADKSKEGKGPNNTDIFLDVLDSGLQIAMSTDHSGSLITAADTKITISVATTAKADITLSVNDKEIASEKDSNALSAEYTFPSVGNYVVKAVAKSGDKTAETSQTFCYAGNSQSAAYPGEKPVMGPVKNADGSVTFCLGAPGKSNVMIVGEWNGYRLDNDGVMNFADVDGMRYFWITVKGLENDRPYGYYFLVDGTYSVGDPYARLVLDPSNDKYIPESVFPNLPAFPSGEVPGTVALAIYQGNINDYDWKVKDFKGVAPSDLIIYEMLLRDFTGTEGEAKGNGTVRMAMEKIPYLKTLGVNAVELLPINEFNGNVSWGYNPNFYFAPDKAYGTPDDYKAFIDLCHENGMAVILDIVFNQTDWQHPWYQMYEPGNNPFYNAQAPHAYSVLNDWNQGYPMVQEQFHDVLKYWLTEYKVDGFRFDLVKGLGDNDSYANAGENATNAFNQSRVDRMRKLQETVNSVKPGAYFINENLAQAKEENEMAESGQLNWANVNNAGCQFAMGYSQDSDLNRFYAPKDGQRLWGSTVSYLESHDEQRLAYKQDMWGVSGVKGDVKASMQRLGSAAAQMILTPGAHMIWQFSEIGNAQNTKDSNGGNDTDPKIVNWDLLSDPAHKGLYDSYCELIAIRNDNKELFTEEASFENSCAVANWASGRTLVSRAGGKELYTVVNPNVDKPLTVTVDFAKNDNSAYRILSKSYLSEPSFSATEKSVTVPANCYVVVGSADVAAVDGVETDGKAFVAYAGRGTIVMESTESIVAVYGASGDYVGSFTTSGEMTVSPGVYVLTGGGQTLKLVVK
uniref:Glycosyl hydrolase family 13 catalytic domain-containing protein n=1 Tax=uncultured Muribaculaceae bacterium TaxID=2301481 RepID=A0A6G8F3L3_9BACT|nr:hypothetical protein Muribac1_0420 [uncultured Muribaculaceae bacterium]